MTDPELLAKRLSQIETCVRELRELARPEAIDTDELRSYIGIADNDTRHETVNHSAEERVVGDVHANSVEGV